MIGADVKALFPSMTSRRTGRILREAVLRYILKFSSNKLKLKAK